MYFSVFFFGGFKNNMYFCKWNREKSGSIDALVYYFALTEDVRKTTFGIARFKKQEEAEERHSLQSNSYAHAYGVEHSYKDCGGSYFQTRP